MKTSKFSAAAFLSSAIVAIAACSSSSNGNVGPNGTGTGTASANVGQFCGSYCSRVNACDNGQDTQTCGNKCTNTNSATFPKLRSDVVGLMASCIQGRDCKSVLGSNVIKTCANEAAAQVAPSAAATNFCDAANTTATKCSQTFDKASCLNYSKLFNDSALDDAGTCLKKSCTDIDACVSAALGGGSSVSIDDGTDNNPGTSTSCTTSASCSNGAQMQVCTTTDSHGACTARSYTVYGQTFACNGCSDCQQAVSDAGRACSGGTSSSSGGSSSSSGGSSSSSGGSSSGSSSGGTCSIDSRFQRGGTCDQCQGSYCCSQIQDCSYDYDCSALTDCLLQCTSNDSNCIQSCTSAHPSGASKLQDYANCYKTCQNAGYCQ